MNKKKELIDSKSESDSDVGLFYEIRFRPSSDSESDFLNEVGVGLLFCRSQLGFFSLRIGAD